MTAAALLLLVPFAAATINVTSNADPACPCMDVRAIFRDAKLTATGDLAELLSSEGSPCNTPPSDGCPSTCRQSVARVAKMSRDVAKMSRAGSRSVAPPSRVGRASVAVCRASVAVCRAAVAADRRVARCRGVSWGVSGGSPPFTPPSRSVAPPSRAGRGLSRRRRSLSRRRRGRVATRRAAVAVCRGVSRVSRGCRGPSFFCQNRDMYLDTHRRGGV